MVSTPADSGTPTLASDVLRLSGFSPGLHTTTRELLHTDTSKTPPKFHETPEGRKNEISGGREKKREILGLPPLPRAPTPPGPPTAQPGQALEGADLALEQRALSTHGRILRSAPQDHARRSQRFHRSPQRHQRSLPCGKPPCGR